MDLGITFLFSATLDEKRNGDALPDIENVLVRATVRAGLLLQRIAMQVEDIYVAKGVHQALAHASEGGIIQVTVVGDHTDNAAPSLFDLPLGKPEELDIVVLKPLRICLTQGYSVDLLVLVDQLTYPVTLVARMAGVRRISKNEKDRSLPFDIAGQARFFCQGREARETTLFQFLPVEGIGKIEGHAFVIGESMPEFFQQKTHLQVTHRIGRHHQFESEKILQDTSTYEVLRSPTTILGLEFGDSQFGGLSHKGHGACGRVEQGDAARGQTVAHAKLSLQKSV